MELRHLQSCLAQLPMLMAVSDPSARYVWTFNHDWIDDDPEAAPVGKTDVELGLHPAWRALYGLKLAVLERRQTCVEELELPTKRGPRLFEFTASPLLERDELVGVSTVGIDITEAGARTRLREEQLRLIAHDLRQPLNVIAIAAARLAGVAEAGSPQWALSESINASVRAMSRVLEDILETGEWETGGVLLRREQTQIGPFLRETFTAGVAPDGLLRMQLEVEPGCVLQIDRAKLGRAVLNLVDNALKFSGPDTPVIVRAGQTGQTLRIAVIDRGPGLDGEAAGHVFDKYRASHGSRASGGKGLGLYAARMIVEAHGGQCRVFSARHHGATFSIELPCSVA